MRLIFLFLLLPALSFCQDTTRVSNVTITEGSGITLTSSEGLITITGAEPESSTSNGITIPPSPGFRMNLNYDGKNWSYDFTNLKICLHYFLGTDGFESVWVQRFDMTEIEFVRLAAAVSDSLVSSTGFTRSSYDRKTWTIDSFGLNFTTTQTKLPLIMDRIVLFFNKPKSKK